MPITNPAIPKLSGQTGGQALARYISVIWRAIIVFGGLTVLIYLVWGALDWIFSSNNEERLKRAKDKMFNGIFGLILLVLSYAIIKLLSVITGLDILNPDWPTF
jgi:hypothetical protein